jgi:hypothetical protein
MAQPGHLLSRLWPAAIGDDYQCVDRNADGQEDAEQCGHAHGLSRHPFRKKGAAFLNNNLRTHGSFSIPSVAVPDRTGEIGLPAYKIESIVWPAL